MDAKDLMGFEAFASSVSSSGAVNRWPRLGDAIDVVTYSVYLNGPLAASLPIDLQEQEFKDVLLHALTEKSLLNPNSARDNLKIGELVTIREAWMTTVLNASFSIDEHGQRTKLSSAVEADYELLSAGFAVHPWIQQQIEAQRQMSLGLTPAIKQAESILGKPVMDLTPDVVSVGKILAQTESYTIQETHAGEVVTHENRRLLDLPSVGEDVLVSYYRGQGQVVSNRKDLTITDPYIDSKTNDLAVDLVASDGNVKETILFNSISAIAKFQEAEALAKEFVIKAMDARKASPKEIAEIPAEKKLTSEIYIDETSGFLAVDFAQNGVPYTVLFDSLRSLTENSKDLKLTNEMHVQAFILESDATTKSDIRGLDSKSKVEEFIEREELKSINPNLLKGSYVGKVVAETAHHVVQDIGQRTALIHDKRLLDKVPMLGEKLSVKYENFRGIVDLPERKQTRSNER